MGRNSRSSRELGIILMKDSRSWGWVCACLIYSSSPFTCSPSVVTVREREPEPERRLPRPLFISPFQFTPAHWDPLQAP